MTSGGIALWVAALGTPLLIRWLARKRIGQQIREDGPFMHLAKAGTPTMGGVALVVASVVGYLMGHAGTHVAFSRPGVLVILVTVCAAAVGFLDDWIKVRHRRSLGLNKRAKLAAQVVDRRRVRPPGRALGRGEHPSVVHPVELLRGSTWDRWGGSCGRW